MKDGFVKVAACSPRLGVADCHFNAKNIALEMKKACEQGVRVIVFPELSICGCTCGDLFFQQTLLEGCEQALEELMRETADMEIAACVGVPVRKGGSLYNCAAVLARGRLLGLVPKTVLRSDSETSESRHFASAPEQNDETCYAGQQTAFGAKLLFTIDGFADFALAAEMGTELWAPQPPSTRHALAGAILIANLAASSEGVGRSEFRREMVKSQSARLVCGYIYCEAGEGESTTDLIFSGHQILAENGRKLEETEPFEPKMAVTEIDVAYLAQERRKIKGFSQLGQEEGYRKIPLPLKGTSTSLSRTYDRFPFIPEKEENGAQRCELILRMQAQGLARRMEHAHAQTAVVGVSGGLDSCLALLVAQRAMQILNRPSTDILAVTMPCFGTTKRTKSNAEMLCEQLGVSFACIPIEQTVLAHFEEIGHDPAVQNVVYENAQARARTYALMDLANARGGLVVGTGDLSELALGWATYNGDHMSMYGVNASIPKTLVRCLVRHCASIAEPALSKILLDILDTPVSPELLPAHEGEIAQVTEDIVGPYELHDFILFYAVGKGFSPRKVYRLMKQAFENAYSPETMKKWLMNFYHRFFVQQFKRSCLPDGVKVGSVALSPRGGWQMPSDAVAELWKKEIRELEE